jgi:hypothetical protein
MRPKSPAKFALTPDALASRELTELVIFFPSAA